MKGVACVLFLLVCTMPQETLGDGSGETRTSLKLLIQSLESAYGKARAQEVFRSVVDTLEKKDSSPDPADVATLVDQKIQELKSEVTNSKNRVDLPGGEDLVNEVLTLSSELSHALREDKTGDQILDTTHGLQSTFSTLHELALKMQKDVASAHDLVDRVSRLTMKVKDKQDLLFRTSNAAKQQLAAGTKRNRLRKFVFIIVTIELLLFCAFTAYKKFHSRKKFQKLV